MLRPGHLAARAPAVPTDAARVTAPLPAGPTSRMPGCSNASKWRNRPRKASPRARSKRKRPLQSQGRSPSSVARSRTCCPLPRRVALAVEQCASGEMPGRMGKTQLRYPRPQQVVKLVHAMLDARKRTRLVALRGQSLLYTGAQELIFALHLAIDSVAQVAQQSHLAPRVRPAKHPHSDGALAGTTRQDLKEIHLLGKHIEAEIGQHAVEAPAPAMLIRQILDDPGDPTLIHPLAPLAGWPLA